MHIVKPSFTIESEIPADVLERLERIGRVCYKSEDRITPGSARRLVQHLLDNHHESVIEHVSVTVRFICDRGVSHELVRHRLASFSQESTRYCNYGKQDHIEVVCPFDEHGAIYSTWHEAVEAAEDAYMGLIANGVTPQIARSVLPICLKTEIVVTANLREWRHIFQQRTSPKAHPQMRELMVPLLAEFQQRIPVVFDDLQP